MTLKQHILLVEDNEGDMILTMEAINEHCKPYHISRVTDGEQAIEFINRQGIFENVELPDLILLDINLPKLDGKEVLSFIKNNVHFKKIPVVVLSTSMSKSDINDCYSLGANCYISKPSDLHEFLKVIAAIESFWLNVVILPVNY